ncbi:cyclomaltodextrinase [Thermosipho melanesiensis]|uniref:Alpha amylase, catalytic region n=2 Tax=Thermosipho melanesiensis TaxID=46541 RepID=A6LNC3_THEM4|nr:cyclomaltodextrinase [Thermosipho melanesiensis]ABR31424.1 alpha amylase, catalytic region [Thermosipho melanesiensis BI429]APT74483.1 cyclomaltodextrinase [Thermosipho melanesiensis]OOC36442.1 cyclomaltodextrinase [Thermosipho melanesiensis]OOC37260.1 cyclomaltodextrinase [Thermosipho melanesiensis]OOC38012.1 cyclomaltodextrinase [Thermosipho melanesiensis]
MRFPIPSWVYDTVIYQIFPDRFFIGKGLTVEEKKQLYEKRGGRVEKWGVPPKRDEKNDHVRVFYGGDLWGIAEKIEYLRDLGVNAIYLTPIFLSNSNHKYDTIDYFKVDPQFGGIRALKRLINSLHAENMKLILDGVFNHVGRENVYFKKALKGKNKYRNMFIFYENNYRGWWGTKSLPELVLEEVSVKNYVIDVLIKYLELGIDGWRLDCGQDLGPEFNRYITSKVKEYSSEKYVISELWTYTGGWDMVDGIMNYHLRENIVSYIEGTNKNFGFYLERMYNETDNILACWNMLDSHDTERLATTINDKFLRKFAIFMQFTYPGVPVIYYGTEVGINGGPDPECRKTMIWNEEKWDNDLRDFYKKLIYLRKNEPALRYGSFELLNNDPIVFMRRTPMVLDTLIVYGNIYDEPLDITISIPEKRLLSGTEFIDMFTEDRYFIKGGMLKIKMLPHSFGILKVKNNIVNNYDQYKRIS